MEKVPLVDGGVERFTLPGAWVLMLTLQHHNRRQHTVLRMYACMHACMHVCMYLFVYTYIIYTHGEMCVCSISIYTGREGVQDVIQSV